MGEDEAVTVKTLEMLTINPIEMTYPAAEQRGISKGNVTPPRGRDLHFVPTSGGELNSRPPLVD